jgi:hypothetical protein
MLSADEAFGGKNGVLGIGDRLAFCGLAHKTFASLGESDDGWSRARAFGVGDDHRLASFHDSHAGVGGSEIDTENATHAVFGAMCMPQAVQSAEVAICESLERLLP